MSNKERFFVTPEISIRDALRAIDENAHKTVIVINNKKYLQGIVSDGDVRRWILQNGSLEAQITQIMNKNPLILGLGYSKKQARKIMQEQMIEILPVIDDNKLVIDVCCSSDLFENYERQKENVNSPVVIMAGGKGTRLDPFTRILPKPLIPIGEKPIIEHIIDRFLAYGCKEFYTTVNYKANMLRAYFNDLERSYNISFIEENKPLGTCGSLHLLDDMLKTTFFVSNCDIIIEANYYDILQLHKNAGNLITIVASLKNYVVPYGVIQLNEREKLKEILEKPEMTWLVNTGLYILEPQVLKDIPKDEHFHITDLISMYLSKNKPVGVYPVSEKSWMDMGQFEEMREMVKRLGLE